MLAEISRIVNEDISNRVNQYDVLFEAITNAIHANATNIICTLKSFDDPLKENDVDIICKKVDVITVSDNGDGLNNDNYNSFCKYRTEFKKALGCKGVGRFVFLKVYEHVWYKSLLAKEKEERSFKFNLDFDTENIKTVQADIDLNSTEISLSGLTSHYLDREKHLDRRIDLDLEAIREKVLLNLIPNLFFYKKKGILITIQFIDYTTLNVANIIDSDVPNFPRWRRFSICARTIAPPATALAEKLVITNRTPRHAPHNFPS